MTGQEFKGETQAERRRFTRKPIKLKVSYRCLDRGNVSSEQANLAEDLGAGGLLLHSPDLLKRDQVLMLALYLPPPDKREGEPKSLDCGDDECFQVEILSRVAWSTPNREGGHSAGIQFLDMDQHNRKWLKEFLVDFKLDQPDSTMYT